MFWLEIRKQCILLMFSSLIWPKLVFPYPRISVNMFGNFVYHLVLFNDQTNGSRFLVSRYWDARTIRQFLVCILQSSCYRSYFSFTDHTPINFHNLKPVISINKRHKTNKKVFQRFSYYSKTLSLIYFCFVLESKYSPTVKERFVYVPGWVLP